MRILGAARRRPEDALVRSIALPPRAICGLRGAPRSDAVSLAGRHTNGSQPGACVGCFPVYAGVLACFREDFVKGGWCGAERYRWAVSPGAKSVGCR